jgi:hypothetical protein
MEVNMDEQTRVLLNKITQAFDELVNAAEGLTDARNVAGDRGVTPTSQQLTDAGYWFDQAALGAAVTLIPTIQSFIDDNRAVINKVRRVA